MLDPENYTEEFWEQNGRVKALAGYIENLFLTGSDEARAIACEIQAIMGFRIQAMLPAAALHLYEGGSAG